MAEFKRSPDDPKPLTPAVVHLPPALAKGKRQGDAIRQDLASAFVHLRGADR